MKGEAPERARRPFRDSNLVPAIATGIVVVGRGPKAPAAEFCIRLGRIAAAMTGPLPPNFETIAVLQWLDAVFGTEPEAACATGNADCLPFLDLPFTTPVHGIRQPPSRDVVLLRARHWRGAFAEAIVALLMFPKPALGTIAGRSDPGNPGSWFERMIRHGALSFRSEPSPEKWFRFSNKTLR